MATSTRGHYRAQHTPARSHVVKVRFTDDEYARLTDGARRARLALASYIATTALEAADGTAVDSARIRAMQEALGEVMQTRAQLAKYGNNVNQAVARFNESGVAPRYLKDAVNTVRQVVRRLDDDEARLAKFIPTRRRR